MPLRREGRAERQGRDYCSTLPINHPQHSHSSHSQIRPGWRGVTATQKEGEPRTPPALGPFPSRVLLRQASPRRSLSLFFLHLGGATGHQGSGDFSKSGSPPAAKPQSRLTGEPTRPSPLLIDLFRTKGDKSSVPSIPGCLLVTKPTSGPPCSPLPAQEFSSEYANRVFKNYVQI